MNRVDGHHSDMSFSIVTTLYYSARYIREFYRRICSEAEAITDDFEIIFVDDGSPDDSLAIALEIQRSDPRVKVIELSRNFGHHKAIITGLTHSRGQVVFLIDSDLEEPPELLGRFYKEFVRLHADVVFGVQKKRKGGVLERISGKIFYYLFNLLSSNPIPENLITARLMTRSYVEALITHREREVFLAGILCITGFKQVPLIVSKGSKVATMYTVRRRVELAIRAITSFSDRPLVLIFYLGSIILVLSGGHLFYLFMRKLLFGIQMKGYTSLIASIWLLGGITIFSMGIIGIYLARIYIEVKRRPYTVVRSIYSSDDSNSRDSVEPIKS